MSKYCDIAIVGIKILHQNYVKQYRNIIHSIYKVELEQNWHHSNHAVACYIYRYILCHAGGTYDSASLLF